MASEEVEYRVRTSYSISEAGKERFDKLCRRRRFPRGVAIEALLDFYDRITEIRDDITAQQRDGEHVDALESLGRYHDAAHLDLDVEEVEE